MSPLTHETQEKNGQHTWWIIIIIKRKHNDKYLQIRKKKYCYCIKKLNVW
jgi:hypothetical protein